MPLKIRHTYSTLVLLESSLCGGNICRQGMGTPLEFLGAQNFKRSPQSQYNGRPYKGRIYCLTTSHVFHSHYNKMHDSKCRKEIALLFIFWSNSFQAIHKIHMSIIVRVLLQSKQILESHLPSTHHVNFLLASPDARMQTLLG